MVGGRTAIAIDLLQDTIEGIVNRGRLDRIAAAAIVCGNDFSAIAIVLYVTDRPIDPARIRGLDQTPKGVIHTGAGQIEATRIAGLLDLLTAFVIGKPVDNTAALMLPGQTAQFAKGRIRLADAVAFTVDDLADGPSQIEHRLTVTVGQGIGRRRHTTGEQRGSRTTSQILGIDAL